MEELFSFPEWMDEVNEIASREAYKLAARQNLVPMEDLHSEMWVWVMQHMEKIEDTLDDPKALAFYLRTVGRKHYLSEKARVEGYSVQDLCFYSTSQLYDILPSVFDHRDWVLRGESGEPGMPRASGDPALSGNLVTTLADISQGLLSIRQDDYNILVWRFKLDFNDEQLGEVLECSPTSANKRVQRAVKRLQIALGGSNPFAQFTGARSPLSNAAARALTSQQWEGE